MPEPIPFNENMIVAQICVENIENDGLPSSGDLASGRGDIPAPFNCRVRWLCAATSATTNAEINVYLVNPNAGSGVSEEICLTIPNSTANSARTNAEVGNGLHTNNFRAGDLIRFASDGGGTAGGFTTLTVVLERN